LHAPPLLRVIYFSRSTAAADRRPQQVSDILAQARAFNAAHGITGLLTVCKDEYLQLLDGPADAVEALLARIQRDSRHHAVDVLARHDAQAPVFAHWSMALAERFEPERQRADRMQALRARMAADPGVRPADFFRFMLAPGDSRRGDAHGEQRTADVVFCSPSGLWGPAVLTRVINNSSVRTGRTVLTPSAQQAERTLIEYADALVPGYGPVRAIAVPGTAVGQPMLLPLIDRLALVVLLLAPSDMPGLGEHLRHWTAIAAQRDSQPDFLVVSSVVAERIEKSIAALKPVAASLHILSLKLSAAAAIWDAARDHLREMRLRPPPASSAPDPSAAQPEPEHEPAPAPAPKPAHEPQAQPGPVEHLLHKLMAIDGTQHAALVDLGPPQRVIASAPGGTAWPGLEAALEFLQLKQALLQRLVSDDAAEELAVTTSTQFLLLRPLAARHPTRFAVLALDRSAAQLGAARLQMQQVLQS
jgi:Sensors of blue-light using FAD